VILKEANLLAGTVPADVFAGHFQNGVASSSLIFSVIILERTLHRGCSLVYPRGYFVEGAAAPPGGGLVGC